MDAKNTLSQRTCGPGCTFTVELDAAGLAPGGFAGLAALQFSCAMIGVEAGRGGRFRVLTARRDAPRGMPGGPQLPPGPQYELDSAPLPDGHVFLRADFDFRDAVDTAVFSWSPDASRWNTLGGSEKLSFDLRYFVSTRSRTVLLRRRLGGFPQFRSGGAKRLK